MLTIINGLQVIFMRSFNLQFIYFKSDTNETPTVHDLTANKNKEFMILTINFYNLMKYSMLFKF